MNRRPGLGSRPEGCGVPAAFGRYRQYPVFGHYFRRPEPGQAVLATSPVAGTPCASWKTSTARLRGGILDFGGGSGELAAAIARRFPDAGVFCYEPSPRIFDEARENLAGLENVVPGPRLSLEGGC